MNKLILATLVILGTFGIYQYYPDGLSSESPTPPPITEELPPITEELPPITEELPPITEERPPVTEELPPITTGIELSTLISWEENQNYAVFFLNYDMYQENYLEEATHVLEALGLQNVTEDIPCYLYEGTEYYLIIPRNTQLPTSIFQCIFEEVDFVKGELLAQIENEPYFIVQCNVSDLFPNIMLYQEEYSFSPSISLRDGGMTPIEGVKDLTSYPDWLLEERASYE